MRNAWLGSIFFLLVGAGSSFGHWSNDSRFHAWYFNGGFGWHASTAQEGYLRGLGAYFDGLGRLHVQNAIAARHFEEAYRMYLKNRKLEVETYYELKRIRDAYLKEKRKPVSKEQRAQWAKSALPPRMSPENFDSNGLPRWPRLLLAPDFDTYRSEIDDRFLERQVDGAQLGLGTENHAAIADAVDKMLELLRKQIHTVSSSEYMLARRFLDSVAFESRFQAHGPVD